MIPTLKKNFTKNGYLLIIAAWLFTLSFVVSNYWAYNSTPKKVKYSLEKYIATQETAFDNLLHDTTSLLLLTGIETDKSLVGLENKPYYVYVYELDSSGSPKVVYWNTSVMELHKPDILRKDGSFSVTYNNVFFELIKHTVSIRNSKYIIACVIPIRWEFSSLDENIYLKTGFVNFPEIEKRYQISSSQNAIQIYNGDKKPLFGITEKKYVSELSSDIISLSAKILGIIFILIFINTSIGSLSEKKGFYYGLSFMVIVIIILRLISYYFPFPFNFKSYEFFDPSIYASTYIQRSLGDLMINMLLIFWLMHYLKFNKRGIEENRHKINESPKTATLIGILSLALFPVCTFGFGRLIFSLVIDSKIPFDVVDFFKLNGYTVISFFILCVIVVIYYYLTTMLWERAIRLKYNFFIRAGVVIAVGLFIVSFLPIARVHSRIAMLIWLMVYLLLLEYQKKALRYRLIQSPFFIFWMMFFAVSVTIAIEYQNKVVDLRQRKAFAEELAMQNDEIYDRLLNISGTIFSSFFNDYTYPKMYDQKQNESMKDSLVRDQFSGFSSKFQLDVYTYDSTSMPLYNNDSITYGRIESVIREQSKPTDIPNVFYSENKYHGFTYLYRKRISERNTGKLLGTVFVIIKPNEFANDNTLYLELFKDGRNQKINEDINYSYAIYNKNKLVTNVNDYSFSDSLIRMSIPPGSFTQMNNAVGNELWYNPGNNMMIVIVKKESTFIESITLFAYLFCSFIVVCILFRSGEYIVQSRFKWRSIRQSLELNIRSQIHTTIILVSLFSFIVIAFSTISFVIIQYNNNNKEKLGKDAQVLTAEVEQALKSNISFSDSISITSVKDISVKNELDKLILDFADMNAFNVNFYDNAGTLAISTNPFIYSKEIVSGLMNPVAYNELKYKHRIEVVQNEQIGTLSYISIYVPLHDDNKIIGYLNIPYLHTQKKLEETISSFLLTIINLNALIFLLAGGIAFWVTKRITNSFIVIGNKMRDINLDNNNEEIEWERRDEIGGLVKEYNRMVRKLDESAKALAQSEREGAWQEMAQQVAHEIKNPLTPMKLSIQLLQRAIQQNDANVKDLSKRVAETLVEQIEQLSKIASDFSNFAKINKTDPEKIALHSVLHTLVDFYNMDEQLVISYTPVNQNIFLFADKTQINRLFTNLIKNAIEASVDIQEKILIEINESVEDGNITVEVKDFGSGIKEGQKQKIFVPNFTTKSSGTGLGLAICKGIVENAQGAIWFETEANKGTSFFVKFALYNEET